MNSTSCGSVNFIIIVSCIVSDNICEGVHVGKSSFINKILNKDYAIVTNIAGTTRDSVDSNIKYYEYYIKKKNNKNGRRIK